MNRRQLLGASAAGLAGLSLARPARASVSNADRKFIFLFNNGGWDPTRVLADGLSNGNVDSEPGSERASAGGVRWVSHPDRPSVDAFLSGNHDRLLILNGVQVRSIAHEICTMIALTGSTSGFLPDWATLLAASAGDRYTLPHLVLSGPAFTGELGTSVARTGQNGQLEGLLSGEILGWSDTAVTGPSRSAESILDRYLARRTGAAAAAARSSVAQRLTLAYDDAAQKAAALKASRYVMDFTGGASLADQAAVAVDALSYGLSRCVTMSYPGAAGGLGWDTHANNDADQSVLWEGLFAGITELVALLDGTPGTAGGSLAEETVLVVLSELGRTPQLNATAGKDHWPYTSVMLLGAGISADRIIGGFDSGWNGETVDLSTGETVEDGHVLAVESVGAALLALGDVDPAEHLPDATPLDALLA